MGNTRRSIPFLGGRGMTIARQTVVAESPDALTDIYQNDINMSVWQRQLSPSLISESLTLVEKEGFTGYRAVLSEAKLDYLDDALPDLARFPQLRADIQLLAEMFCCLFEKRDVGLRLSPLSSAMCPKFHVDHVPCRLITSYCGGGTQWLPHHTVNRSKLGAGSNGLNDSESGLYSSADAIQTLATGDVALLKGERWEGNKGAGLVHRSPEILPNQKRLLLTLDYV